MGLIVISKVLKYKAFIFAVILILSLAFFQSNQALHESTGDASTDENNSEVSNTAETPSIPEIPNLPDFPELPGEDDESESRSQTRISISVKTNTNNPANLEGDSESDETIIETFEREISSGSIKLSFTSNGGDFKIKEKIEDEEGKTSVKFSSKSSQKTENKFSSEFNIE